MPTKPDSHSDGVSTGNAQDRQDTVTLVELQRLLRMAATGDNRIDIQAVMDDDDNWHGD